jgi:hypothetical protein
MNDKESTQCFNTTPLYFARAEILSMIVIAENTHFAVFKLFFREYQKSQILEWHIPDTIKDPKPIT